MAGGNDRHGFDTIGVRIDNVDLYQVTDGRTGDGNHRRLQPRRLAEPLAFQLAAPFDLPDEYYANWKRISAFRFDKRLSQ